MLSVGPTATLVVTLLELGGSSWTCRVVFLDRDGVEAVVSPTAMLAEQDPSYATYKQCIVASVLMTLR